MKDIDQLKKLVVNLWTRFWHHIARHWGLYTIGVAGVVATIWPLGFSTYHGKELQAANAGQFGDFIGGFIGTIFSLVSVLLIYSNLVSQTRYSNLGTFQNKLFSMIEFHKANLQELELGSRKGRSVFIPLLKEMRAAIEAVNKAANELNMTVDEETRIDIAYISFFYGVGKTSSRITRESLLHHSADLVNKVITVLEDRDYQEQVKKDHSLGYRPFQGHQIRLGHYFRNIYQIVKFVHFQPFLNDEEKYEFVRNIRVQLSNQEQGLLFLNYISSFGAKWLENEFITRYRLIRNLPVGFFDSRTEIDIGKFFSVSEMEYSDFQKTRKSRAIKK